MDNQSPAKLFRSITERQWQMKVFEMVVKGFDGLTGIALFVSAFGLRFGGYREGPTTWGWTLAFIFIGLNLVLRSVVYFLEKFVFKSQA